MKNQQRRDHGLRSSQQQTSVDIDDTSITAITPTAITVSTTSDCYCHRTSLQTAPATSSTPGRISRSPCPSPPPDEESHPSQRIPLIVRDRKGYLYHEDPLVYRNKTVQLIMDWKNTGSCMKSNEEVTRLVHDVLLHPDFKINELLNFDATRENQNSDAAEHGSTSQQAFQQIAVKIEVPSGSRDTASR